MTDQVTVTLPASDAQLIVGVLEGEKLRARGAEDEPPESAATYAHAQEFFLSALCNQGRRATSGGSR